jgi:DNA processing protein
MSDIRYSIALTMLSDVGPASSKKLIAVFGTPEEIFRSPVDDIAAVKGIGINRAKNIKAFSSWNVIEKQIEILLKKGIKAVGFNEPSYPALLREVDDAPVVIYFRGDMVLHDRYAIAVVGSRKPTSYGAAAAESISCDLASLGFTIVSGMARGIDSLSHKGALGVGGRTIAVLGSGLDVPYPPENKMLMERIAGSGCVISEFPAGTPPNREHFPRRNRVISGMSLGVLVIEATSHSGSLITAQYALDQGREVFAVPGNVTSLTSEGTNELIRKGALLTRKADDIVEELAPVLRGLMKQNNRSNQEVTEEEQQLCALLSREPKQIDNIFRESRLASSKVLGILLALELKGIVKQTTGKRFYLA